MEGFDIEKLKQQSKLPDLKQYDQIYIAISHTSYINGAYIHEPNAEAFY